MRPNFGDEVAVAVVLIDLAGMDTWIRRLELGKPAYTDKVQILIQSMSHGFAKVISVNPKWEILPKNGMARDLFRRLKAILLQTCFYEAQNVDSDRKGKNLSRAS